MLRGTGFSTLWVDGFQGPAYSAENPRDTHELFTFPHPPVPDPINPGDSVLMSTHVSSFIDLRSKHSLLVHSPSFGNYTSIGPNGTRTILLKVPVDSAYGSVIHFQHAGHPADFVEVSTRGLKNLTFELRDAHGNLVDLKGGHWSMTIVFAERPR